MTVPIDEFDLLQRKLEHLGQIQVDSDTIYYNRGSVIVLAQGFLAVAAATLYGNNTVASQVGVTFIGVLAALLSGLWYFFEQRNQIYFDSRNAILKELELRLVTTSAAMGIAYPLFWSRVPEIVSDNAKWQQRWSAPRIMRTYVPLLFAVAWIAVAVSPAVVHIEPTKPVEVRLR